EDFVGFEVEAFDLVVRATAFDGGPVHDGSAAGNGVAHIGLLEDLLEAGASAAVGEELITSKVGVASAIDDVEEAQLHCIYDRHFEVEVPGAGRIIIIIFDFRFSIFDYRDGIGHFWCFIVSVWFANAAVPLTPSLSLRRG